MERIVKISSQFTTDKQIQSDSIEHGTDTGFQLRRTQALEDQKKIMHDWKSKSDLNGDFFAKYVIGEIYPYYKAFIEYSAKELSFNYSDFIHKGKEEQRIMTNEIFIKYLKKFPITMDKFENEPWLPTAHVSVLGSYYAPVGTKMGVHLALYCKSIHTLGTEKHRKYVERGLRLVDVGCFALTEISHGSNVQGMLTTAIFDEHEKCFVINTPTERASKFWIGGASQTSNMAVVGANLVVKNNNYGIHLFIVQLRDTETHDLMPGVSIKDCGDKQGLNGVDNGMISFRNVSIPLESLLDKITQVSQDGVVTSAFYKKEQRFAVQLSGLCDGRAKVMITSCFSGIRASAIALRYATVRRQFGPNKNDERSIISYPQYQNRVFPILASSLIQFFAVRESNLLWMKNYKQVLDPSNQEVKEMHAIISVMKPIATWATSEGLNQIRQALGGYGYLNLSGIPTLIGDFHVMMTWEGDNYILIHQTAKFILKGVFRLLSDRPVKYKSLEYLTLAQPEEIFPDPIDESALRNLEILQKLMSYRACKAALTAGATFQKNLTSKEAFQAWNDSVPFGHSEAAIYYGELFVFETALRKVQSCTEATTKTLLSKLLTIYSLIKIKESWTHVGSFLERDIVDMINTVLLAIYSEIQHDLVRSLDDLMVHDDFANSVLGCQDGNVYGRLLSKLSQNQENYGKPKTWRNIWENRVAY